MATATHETNAAYHADMTHFGSTMIRCYNRSPQDFYDLYVRSSRAPDPPSNQMILGSVTHCVVSGGNLDEEFLVAYGCKSRQGNAWKDAAAEAAEKQLTPILPDQLERARAMREAVMRHPIAAQLLSADGPTEQSIRWQHASGLKLKCKPDKLILGPPSAVCLNLKTSRDPAPAQWPRWAWYDYQYHHQAVFYLQGVRTIVPGGILDHIWVVVGNEPPHDVYCYKLSDEAREIANCEMEDTLHDLAQSIYSDYWIAPGQNELNSFDPPRRSNGDDVTLQMPDGEEVTM